MLTALSPILERDKYIFVTIPGAKYGDLAGLEPIACIREREGLTLVLNAATAAAAGFSTAQTMKCITLGVHSSLVSVGLTAAVAAALAEHGIPANVWAGFHHDHIFVPAPQAEAALEALKALSRS